MEQTKRYFTALTIAGSDSGGGAGIQADLKTFSSLGVFCASVITAITAQNTLGVRSVEVLSEAIVRDQLRAVMDDIGADAAKTGMLPTPRIVETVARTLDKYTSVPLVVDPVMVSTSGSRLAEDDVAVSYRKWLYPRATVITPNIPEAVRLSGIDIKDEQDIFRAGETLISHGCRAVLIKGGHLVSEQSCDYLFREGYEPLLFAADHVDTLNLHGTGCTLSSAIAAFLAMGADLVKAVEAAKEYISAAIIAGSDITLGAGHGPVNHFFDPKQLKTK